ncbi:hypothetical protein UUU_17240 [Klebsiella pneumoniae subsp. pneumoniae DSM 30104 = JCM 1662 = NBRC 14940]|nr:hypothetical protein UUU_17240 [Klebsiella pneumoniae subsp. pneumoniae DSM 30104 = JCM 1662 = NBRC 14940]
MVKKLCLSKRFRKSAICSRIRISTLSLNYFLIIVRLF